MPDESADEFTTVAGVKIPFTAAMIPAHDFHVPTLQGIMTKYASTWSEIQTTYEGLIKNPKQIDSARALLAARTRDLRAITIEYFQAAGMNADVIKLLDGEAPDIIAFNTKVKELIQFKKDASKVAVNPDAAKQEISKLEFAQKQIQGMIDIDTDKLDLAGQAPAKSYVKLTAAKSIVAETFSGAVGGLLVTVTGCLVLAASISPISAFLLAPILVSHAPLIGAGIAVLATAGTLVGGIIGFAEGLKKSTNKIYKAKSSALQTIAEISKVTADFRETHGIHNASAPTASATPQQLTVSIPVNNLKAGAVKFILSYTDQAEYIKALGQINGVLPQFGEIINPSTAERGPWEIRSTTRNLRDLIYAPGWTEPAVRKQLAENFNTIPGVAKVNVAGLKNSGALTRWQRTEGIVSKRLGKWGGPLYTGSLITGAEVALVGVAVLTFALAANPITGPIVIGVGAALFIGAAAVMAYNYRKAYVQAGKEMASLQSVSAPVQSPAVNTNSVRSGMGVSLSHLFNSNASRQVVSAPSQSQSQPNLSSGSASPLQSSSQFCITVSPQPVTAQPRSIVQSQPQSTQPNILQTPIPSRFTSSRSARNELKQLNTISAEMPTIIAATGAKDLVHQIITPDPKKPLQKEIQILKPNTVDASQPAAIQSSISYDSKTKATTQKFPDGKQDTADLKVQAALIVETALKTYTNGLDLQFVFGGKPNQENNGINLRVNRTIKKIPESKI
jgi:hypothetical protein